MARVLALIPDLLFGSRVQASLSSAGHEVELIADEARLRSLLAEVATLADAVVLIVDLTNDALDGPELVQVLSAEGTLARTRTLGFYAHVDVSVREQAEQAGFDLVVPRSRMSREGPDLLARLVSNR